MLSLPDLLIDNIGEAQMQCRVANIDPREDRAGLEGSGPGCRPLRGGYGQTAR